MLNVRLDIIGSHVSGIPSTFEIYFVFGSFLVGHKVYGNLIIEKAIKYDKFPARKNLQSILTVKDYVDSFLDCLKYFFSNITVSQVPHE